jgi:hypothetical protein
MKCVFIQMSAALSAAKKRRAPAAIEPPKIVSSQPSQPSQANGLTLQQVIALIDRRLTTLETNNVDDNSLVLDDMSEEYESRFTILANEISELKQTILSLQTYTMDVNKMLYDEKIARDTGTFDL